MEDPREIAVRLPGAVPKLGLAKYSRHTLMILTSHLAYYFLPQMI